MSRQIGPKEQALKDLRAQRLDDADRAAKARNAIEDATKRSEASAARKRAKSKKATGSP